MPAAALPHALIDIVLCAHPSPEVIRQRVHQIQCGILAHSKYLDVPDFKAIHPSDLDFLFRAYDDQFFDGLCTQALQSRRLSFRLSSRMTRTGGTTAKHVSRTGEERYEISIATSILFDGFGASDRTATVGGLVCENRLSALQRILEHEIVHLAENLCWGDSNCSAQRFQDIAARFFLHQAHTHNLITRRERAAELGVRVGSMVAFQFEGRKYTGRVNRITKRATVLVADSGGVLFSDGLKYKTFYVPLSSLTSV